MLDPDEVRRINPALQGKFVAALHCSTDAAVESRVALPAVRQYLAASGRYAFEPDTEARSIAGTAVHDDRGRTHEADLVLVCAGAAHGGLVREIAGDLPVRRVRLQMMQTAPWDQRLTTAIADGDSFRYYPGFAGAALDELQRNESQAEIAHDERMQLLCVQRLGGGLTIGDTHEYAEPFGFDVGEDPYAYLVNVVEEFLGQKLPPCSDGGQACTASASTRGAGVPGESRHGSLGDHRTRWTRDDVGARARRTDSRNSRTLDSILLPALHFHVQRRFVLCAILDHKMV